MELRVGKKYRLGRKIGSGSFGDIYLGTNMTTGEEVRCVVVVVVVVVAMRLTVLLFAGGARSFCSTVYTVGDMTQGSTPPAPTFSAWLLRTKYDSDTKRHVFEKLSMRYFQRYCTLVGTNTLLDVELSSFENRARGCVPCGTHCRLYCRQ